MAPYAVGEYLKFRSYRTDAAPLEAKMLLGLTDAGFAVRIDHRHTRPFPAV